MTYEEKRQQVGMAVVEAVKLSSKGNPPEIYAKNNQYLKNVPLNEITAILNQFQDEGKLKIQNITSSSFFPDYETDSNDLFIFEVLDVAYFNDMFSPKEIDIEHSPMRKIRKRIEYATGMTNEESAKIRAIENQNIESSQKNDSNKEYFVEYKDDRTILLNGKIDIGRPRFNTPSEILFSFLYKHPNEIFTIEQLEDKIKMKIEDKLPKVIDRMGFRRGLKKAFFDIHEDTINYKKTTVRFRNKVTL